MLTRDDREDKRQSQAGRIYSLDREVKGGRKASTESLTGLRHTLPSRALAFRTSTRKVSRSR